MTVTHWLACVVWGVIFYFVARHDFQLAQAFTIYFVLLHCTGGRHDEQPV